MKFATSHLANSVQLGLQSIGTRLFVAVMAAASLGLAGLGYAFYQKLESVSLLQLINQTDTKVRKLDAELRSSESFLKSLVATTELLHLRGQRSPALYEQLMLSYMSVRPSLITGFGVMQLPYGLVDRKWFGSYIEESLPNRGITVPGLPKFSQVELWQVDHYPERQYYTNAIKANQYFWSEPYINDIYPVPLMTFAGPIRDRQGKIVAIMNGDINIKDLLQVKEKSEQVEGEYYVLLTDEGTLLSYSPDPQKADQLANIRSIAALKPVWNEISHRLAQNQFQGHFKSDATNSYWVYQKIPTSQWLMLQSIPYRAIIYPALFGAMSSTLIVGLLLAGTVILFVKYLNSKLQPILGVCDATLKDMNLFMSPQDEISRLSQAFFLMVDRQNTLLKQLQVTNSNLVESHRIKDFFLANMSHELRTPINAILGMTEALSSGLLGELTPKQSKALNTVEKSGFHLLELINDILALVEIESGQFELFLDNVAIADLCAASLARVQPQALKKNIQIENKLPQNLPSLFVDERRIRQVLINLLSNAIKFTPAGGHVTLAVELVTTTDESGLKSWLKIAVNDTGIGIAPEDIHKLFQPFIQLDGRLNRHYEGTGLGLALVKRIVELHGGYVVLTSEVGVGSCFTVTLPCSVGEVYEPTYAIQLDQAKPPLPTALEAKTCPLILLIGSVNINTMATYLEAKGYRLLLAKNGAEAIALMESTSLDLILINFSILELDALEMVKQIRSKNPLDKVPIIALIASTDDKAKCLSAGVNSCLSKPITMKQLAMAIQQILSTT